MAGTDQSVRDYFRYRIRRDTSGAVAWFREHWRGARWFRWASAALVGLLVVWAVFWAVFTHDLPDAGSLL